LASSITTICGQRRLLVGALAGHEHTDTTENIDSDPHMERKWAAVAKRGYIALKLQGMGFPKTAKMISECVALDAAPIDRVLRSVDEWVGSEQRGLPQPEKSSNISLPILKYP